MIDPVCPRHTAIIAAGRVPLMLTNGPASPEVVIVPRHKKHAPAGNKATTMASSLLLDQADAALIAENEEVSGVNSGVSGVNSGASGVSSGRRRPARGERGVARLNG